MLKHDDCDYRFGGVDGDDDHDDGDGDGSEIMIH